MSSQILNATIIAINFDLTVKECKAVFGGSQSKAYRVLKKDMTEHGFIHDQGSGYISEKPLTQVQIIRRLKGLFSRNPWLNQCCKKLRVTKVAEDIFNGNAHDDLMHALGEISSNDASKKPRKRLQSKLESDADKHLAEIETMDIAPERKAELRRGIDEIYSRKPPKIAEIKAELHEKTQ